MTATDLLAVATGLSWIDDQLQGMEPSTEAVGIRLQVQIVMALAGSISYHLARGETEQRAMQLALSAQMPGADHEPSPADASDQRSKTKRSEAGRQ